MVVVQRDVKKALDHVDHGAAFKAMRLQGLSPLSMVLVATTGEATRQPCLEA